MGSQQCLDRRKYIASETSSAGTFFGEQGFVVKCIQLDGEYGVGYHFCGLRVVYRKRYVASMLFTYATETSEQFDRLVSFSYWLKQLSTEDILFLFKVNHRPLV